MGPIVGNHPRIFAGPACKKGNGVLPGATCFEAAIYVFAIHGVIYPMNRRIFQRDGVRRTQYSSIPSFHHYNGERSELSSFIKH
jgi:hypothetical protein